jgi:serine/threonine protein kinase
MRNQMSALSSESWHEIGPYLDQLLDMSEGERAAWLRSLREKNPALVTRLESLLDEHRSLAQERFLERGPAILPTRSALAGNVVGVYTLLAPIGAGGMGSVWLAERSDGEIRQRVAVKLLQAGGQRSGWRERFLKERQLLASLNHASIVHVIDAGRADDGQPYLVMEYIEGSPIDLYAAQIPLRDRLTLFLRVCDGVSHAHRRLIIHRDLKPSNILVDATGQPKLLDFGIAKLLDDTGDPTQTIERMLTPSYASPEQFRGTAQTTATDIYSLGAVLYKLLTGHSPHESQTQSSHPAVVLAGEREILAATQLNPNLPADVDYILRKALRNEPEERYASVEALANDVRALIEWRPVEARSGDAWYRVQKFLRRYWVPVTAAALVIASLSVGLYIANHERAIAQKRFQDVRQLSNRLFDIDLQVRSLPGSSTARQLIVETSLEYLGRLAADARKDQELALDVGNAYMRVARAQGVPTSPNLGQMDRAEQNLQRAEGLVQPVLQSHPANRLALLRSAQIAHDRMLLARFNGRHDEAQALAHRSAGALEKFGAGRGDELVARDVLATYLNVASQYVRDEEFGDALRLCDHAIEIGRSLDVQSYTGNFLWVKADMFQRLGNLDEAMSAVDESIRVLNPSSDGIGKGSPTLNFVHALTFKGKLFGQDDIVSMGRFDEAASTLTRSFTLLDDLVHQDPKDQLSRDRLADAGVNLGDVLRHFDVSRSLDIYDHTLRHLAEVTDNSAFRRFEVDALAGSSYSLRQLGRSREARQRLDAAFERLRQLKLYPVEKMAPGSEAEDALRALAEYEAGNGDAQRGIDRYEEILNLTRAANSRAETSLSDALERSNLFRAKAALHRRAGQIDAASALEARCRDLWQAWARKLPNNAFVQRQIQALDSQ